MPYIQKHPKYKWAIALGDYSSLVTGMIISVFFLNSFASQLFGVGPVAQSSLLLGYIIYSVFQILLFQLIGLYHIQTISNYKLSLTLLTNGCFLSIPLFFFLASRLQINFPGIHFFFILFISTLGLLATTRKICLWIIQHTNLLSDRVVIIGAGSKGKSMQSSLSDKIRVKKTIGFLDDNIPKDTMIHGLPILGTIFQSHEIANANRIDFFVMAIDNIPRDHFFRIIRYFNEHNLTIYITSNYLKFLQKNMQADTFNKYGLIRIGQPAQSAFLVLSKRVFDIISSLLGIIFLSPLLICISILIKIGSKGPVIYKQTRIGKGGRPFTFYKFRSMYVNSDTDSSRNERVVNFIRGQANSNGSTKIVNRSRITSIGKVIRKTSLDELPQLFNVLRGDMSLVGPRPCLPVEWNAYESWQRQRLMFMPGCTGIWQVSGRSTVNFEETVIMDLYYNCNVSLWLDLKILLSTIPVMMFSKGGE